jgi:hypothetical protein
MNKNDLINLKKYSNCGERVEEYNIRSSNLTAEIIAKLFKLTVESVFLTFSIGNERKLF